MLYGEKGIKLFRVYYKQLSPSAQKRPNQSNFWLNTDSEKLSVTSFGVPATFAPLDSPLHELSSETLLKLRDGTSAESRMRRNHPREA